MAQTEPFTSLFRGVINKMYDDGELNLLQIYNIFD